MFKEVVKQRMKSIIILFAILATTAYAIDKIPVGNPNGTSVFGGDVEIATGKKLVVETIEAPTGGQPVGGVPAGMIAPFAGSTPPTGWLLCNGATLDSVANPEYAPLYAVIGTTWGGSSATSFNIPNLLGRTLKGAGTITDGNGGVAVALGAYQDDTTNKNGLVFSGSVGADNVTSYRNITENGTGSHTHTVKFDNGSVVNGGAGLISTATGTSGFPTRNEIQVLNGAHGHLPTIEPADFEHSHADSFALSDGDTETAPKSYGVNYIIKY